MPSGVPHIVAAAYVGEAANRIQAARKAYRKYVDEAADRIQVDTVTRVSHIGVTASTCWEAGMLQALFT